MVNISINGKKSEREFANMAQALAFAYQNGECYVAEKLELVNDKQGAKEPEKPKEKPVGTPVGNSADANKEAAVDNPDQAV